MLDRPAHETNPLVSVIIPSYNSLDYIEDAVASVATQSYQNHEVIIVDDCSDDGSYELIKRISDNYSGITLTRTPTNSGGPATPRNIGLDLAKGQLIAFLDSDDVWQKHKLELQVSTFLNTDADMTCCGISLIDETSAGAISKKHPPSKSINKNSTLLTRLSFDQMLKKNMIAMSSVVIKKSSLSHQKFSTKKNHIAIEDYHLWLRLLANPNFVAYFSPTKLVLYRLRNGSLSSSKFRMAVKIYGLLGEFNLSHIWCGLGKPWYFCNYLIRSFYRSIHVEVR